MSIMVVSAAKAADRSDLSDLSDQSDIVCAQNKCVLYNTISFATFAAYAGCGADGGLTVTNGNNGFVLAALTTFCGICRHAAVYMHRTGDCCFTPSAP